MSGRIARRPGDGQVDPALERAIDEVRQDAEFMGRLEALRDRDREILERLAE